MFDSLLMLLAGLLGLAVAWRLFQEVLSRPEGSERMQHIASLISQGTSTFLMKELSVMIYFIIAVTGLLLVTLGAGTAASYVLGAFCSATAGFIGVRAATRANVRTAYAASQRDPAGAFITAFNGGAIMGLSVAAIGLCGLGFLFFWMHEFASVHALIGFGMGASSVALFARVAGGIFTKAADVGSDLVGKIEADIPEDDPRNPGVIADNVGDNVGDVAGMGADIFESYVGAMLAAMLIGAQFSFGDPSLNYGFMVAPFYLGIMGLGASILAVRAMDNLKDGDPAIALRKATLLSTILFLVFSFAYTIFSPSLNLWLWIAIFLGSVSGICIGIVAEYFTSGKPMLRIVQASRTGAATNIIAGIAVGLMSTVPSVICIALTIMAADWCGGMYAVALAAVAMLSTVGISMSVDAYGPIADNAGGISQLCGLGPETRAITDRLDSLGNTTAAVGKGFAIGSAALTSLALFGAFAQTVSSVGTKLDLSILNPSLLFGALIGAIIPCAVSAMTITSVSRAAGSMVEEIRRQFREIPGLLTPAKGESLSASAEPDVARCVEISTSAALREMKLPGITAIVAPVIVGFVFGADSLAGMLLGATITGVVLALFMANAGGAWDNAKKAIEESHRAGIRAGIGAFGSTAGDETLAAAIVGDTVGDPCKDTAGPALNILVKLMSIVALLIAPLM